MVSTTSGGALGFGNDPSNSCCRNYFDWANPTFTLAGTCYSTNATITEMFASSLSSVKIFANARDDIPPGKKSDLVEYVNYQPFAKQYLGFFF